MKYTFLVNQRQFLNKLFIAHKTLFIRRIFDSHSALIAVRVTASMKHRTGHKHRLKAQFVNLQEVTKKNI